MMYYLVYSEDDVFYSKWMYSVKIFFGVFCLGGIVVNIIVLWIVCNWLLKVDGDYKGIVV